MISVFGGDCGFLWDEGGEVGEVGGVSMCLKSIKEVFVLVYGVLEWGGRVC